MALEKDIWTDIWPDHYVAGTWAPKHREWVKLRMSKSKDKTQTDRFQSRIHTQPSWYPYQDETCQNQNARSSETTGRISTHKIYTNSVINRIKDDEPSKRTVTPKGSSRKQTQGFSTKSSKIKRKTITWDPNGDFHDDYSERSARVARSRSAPGEREYGGQVAVGDGTETSARHYHDCQHDGNCNPVGYYYNQVDPWRCQFCKGLDSKKKHTTHICLADKHGTDMVCDPISELNLERRAHLYHRRHNRKHNHADMRSVEEMAHRMNMAAMSGMPIDYRNHMECKVHWRM